MQALSLPRCPQLAPSLLFLPALFLTAGLLAVLWAGCLAELGARCFHHLVDPDDRRTFDPDKSAREHDRVASLLKKGRHEEASQLCAALKESGDANVLVLEALLARHGVQVETDRKPKPLAVAYLARMGGNLTTRK